MKSEKTDFIKYEKLSNEIKSEITTYHESSKDKKKSSMEETTQEWFNLKFDEWLLSRNNESANKRKHYRVEIEIPISVCETLIESTDEEDSKLFIGQVVNISKGGLYFISKTHIKISSIIKVKIILPHLDVEKKEVEALAMVTRSDEINENEYGIGLVFSSIYDDDRSNLEVFILRKLANYIYSS